MTQVAFNPNEHLMQIKNRTGATDYLPVQWRLVWFRECCPQGTIDTEELCVDLDREVEEEVYVWNNEKRRSEKVVKRAKGYARYKAIVTDGMGGRATGTKSENAASFPDFVEKAETGATGRAMAGLGYGTQFAPELNEIPRIVDTPVERERDTSEGAQSGQINPAPATSRPSDTEPSAQPAVLVDQAGTPVNASQLETIRKICKVVGRAEPEHVQALTYLQARGLIQQLTSEYNALKQKRASNQKGA